MRRARDRASRDIFVLAAHFADLYNVDAARPEDLRTLPGRERAIKVAGEDAPPLVLEFDHRDRCRARRHDVERPSTDRRRTREPASAAKIWARVLAAEVPNWIAAKTRPVTVDQAARVDAAMVEYADGRLPYARFAELLEAAVIEVDPDAAAAREKAVAEQRYAPSAVERALPTDPVREDQRRRDHSHRTLAHLAQALQALGDDDDFDRRRTKAMLMLADPDQAVTLLRAYATATASGL